MTMTSSTPSIRVYNSSNASDMRFPGEQHHRRPSHPSPPRTSPMLIRGGRDNHVPPPLPPPRHIGERLKENEDIGWQWGNTPNTSFGGNKPVKPGSSLLGGQSRRSISTSLDDMSSDSLDGHSDEERKARPSLANHRFTSERQLGLQAHESSSRTYDQQLLSKIGGPANSNAPSTPTRTTAPPLSLSAQEAPHTSFNKFNLPLKPLSVPDRLQHSMDSPISQWPSSPAMSPLYTGFGSPAAFDGEAHRRRFGSMSTTGALDGNVSSRQHRGSYDHSTFAESEFGEDSGMRDLDLNDPGSEDYQAGSKAGQKRRASSPPREAAREDRPTGSGNTDLYHRRSQQMLGSRNSPMAPRYPINPGSVASASPFSAHASSFASSYELSTARSSMTSYNGDPRLSPSARSPAEVETVAVPPPFAASVKPSPRGSVSRPHQRDLADDERQFRKMSTDSIQNVLSSRQNSISGMPGAYICDCCPKKPKKFDSEEDLRLHILEKPHACQYCPCRFKNKNEAERHQMSIHVRLHSWACANLAGVQAAYHPSRSPSTAADVCGYCGQEFENPPNWPARTEHLSHVHKFGECNVSKKFWRADHYRQHLKHSHAGTSGKWTNMLENACMKDEPPERNGSISGITTHLAKYPKKPEIIDEVQNES